MDREMKKEQGTEGYAGVFPWNNYPAFARLVIDQSVELEASIPPGTDLVFQDRSLIDNVGYGHGYSSIPSFFLSSNAISKQRATRAYCSVRQLVLIPGRRCDGKRPKKPNEHMSS